MFRGEKEAHEMKPRLKPKKGWTFRLILCDHNGIAIAKDFKHRNMAPATAEKLCEELTRVRMEKITGHRRLRGEE